ncbi:MAG: accessory gene regulator B family protein [Lachnospiraceae bacterium]
MFRTEVNQMITKLSRSIAFYFVREGIVEERDADLYRYGMETIFCSIFDVGIVLLAGILYGRVLEAAWYYIVFCCLRKLSDGYHAKTFRGCKLLMVLMMCSVMAVSSLKIQLNLWKVLVSAGVLAVMLLKVSLKCERWMYLLGYILIELKLSGWKGNAAILTMCAFYIVAIASNINKIEKLQRNFLLKEKEVPCDKRTKT